MIGGDDLVLEGPTSDADVDVMLRALRSVWPDGVLKMPGGRKAAIKGLQLFPVHGIREVFVHEDEKACDSWESNGRTDENADSMIWIVVAPHGIAFTMEDRESSSGQIVTALMTAVRANRWLRPSGQIWQKAAA